MLELLAPNTTCLTSASPPLMVIVPELVQPARLLYAVELRSWVSTLRSPLFNVRVEVIPLLLLPTARTPAPPPLVVHHTVPPLMFIAAGEALSTPIKLHEPALLPPTLMDAPLLMLTVPQ